MGECAHQRARDVVGVCPICLQKKLTRVWRGEEDATVPPPTLTSRTPHPSFDAESETPGVDWSATSSSRKMKTKKKKSVTIIADESLARTGLPLVDRVAKETALRVIQEVGDDGISVESERNSAWEKQVAETKVGSQWQCKITGFRPKSWVKGLGMSNKVVPCKSDNQSSPSRLKKSKKLEGQQQQRKFGALRLQVQLRPARVVIPVSKVVTSETVIEGMPDEILKPEDMDQRLKTSYNSVLSWLRDLPSPQTHFSMQLDEDVPEGEVVVPAALSHDSPRNNDEDLTHVGHLHEIAEEHEINSIEEEPEASITNHLNEVSSFGNFLIRAAQRQPRAGLSRVAIATAGKS